MILASTSVLFPRISSYIRDYLPRFNFVLSTPTLLTRNLPRHSQFSISVTRRIPVLPGSSLNLFALERTTEKSTQSAQTAVGFVRASEIFGNNLAATIRFTRWKKT